MRSITPSGPEHAEPDVLATALLAQLVAEHPAQFSLEEPELSVKRGPLHVDVEAGDLSGL